MIIPDPHGYKINIWTPGNQHVFMTFAASWSAYDCHLGPLQGISYKQSQYGKLDSQNKCGDSLNNCTEKDIKLGAAHIIIAFLVIELLVLIAVISWGLSACLQLSLASASGVSGLFQVLPSQQSHGWCLANTPLKKIRFNAPRISSGSSRCYWIINQPGLWKLRVLGVVI